MTDSVDTEIKVLVDGREIPTWFGGYDAEGERQWWQHYAIESDMMTPSDAFSVRAPNHDARMAGAVRKGSRVQVLVDGGLQMSGYVDSVSYSTDTTGAYVEITGRDDILFLVDCSAPVCQLRNVDLQGLAEQLSTGWIDEWVVDNSENRHRLLLAQRRFKRASKPSAPTRAALAETEKAAANLARVKREIFFTVKVEPGETAWDVIDRYAKAAGMLVWLSADGKGIIARPDYDQKPLYRLRLLTPDSGRSAENNIERSSVVEDWRNQYSRVTVYGTTGNTRANYGASSTYEGYADEDSITVNRPLVLTDGDIKKVEAARKRAELERDRRAFEALTLTYTVRGHYQSGYLWEVDTLADVIDEPAGIQGEYYITRRRFSGDDSGRRTELTLHEKGALLA